MLFRNTFLYSHMDFMCPSKYHLIICTQLISLFDFGLCVSVVNLSIILIKNLVTKFDMDSISNNLVQMVRI